MKFQISNNIMQKKEYFNWNEASKLKFIHFVQKYERHKKTSETMKDKWAKIHAKVNSEAIFAGLSIKEDALKYQFNRFKDAVLKECGISEEGDNLSGLPEEASMFTKLMDCTESRLMQTLLACSH